MTETLFNITNDEIKNMWVDIIKFLTIAIIIHILLYSIDNIGNLFDELSLKFFIYLTISIIIYHLIIKNFVEKKILGYDNQTKKSNNTISTINKKSKKINKKRLTKKD